MEQLLSSWVWRDFPWLTGLADLLKVPSPKAQTLSAAFDYLCPQYFPEIHSLVEFEIHSLLSEGKDETSVRSRPIPCLNRPTQRDTLSDTDSLAPVQALSSRPPAAEPPSRLHCERHAPRAPVRARWKWCWPRMGMVCWRAT